MERFLAICHPLHLYTMSGLQRAVRIIAALWIVSFVSAVPFAVFTKVHYLKYPKSEFCLLFLAHFNAQGVDTLFHLHAIFSIFFIFIQKKFKKTQFFSACTCEVYNFIQKMCFENFFLSFFTLFECQKEGNESIHNYNSVA